MLAYQPHLQNTRQQWPFPESRFGGLLGETRHMTYECDLVARPSQPTISLRVLVMTAIVSDMASAEGKSIIMASKTGSKEPFLLSPMHPKNSYVAIRQTCRQVHHEAFHIFYA